MGNSYRLALEEKRGEVLSELESLRREAAQLASQIALKENQLRNLNDLLALEDGQRAQATQAPNAVSMDVRSVGITDHAAEVLAAVGKPVHYRQLLTLLAERQVYVPGKDPGANLLAHVSRDARFARVGRGMYGLADWPSVRSATKTRRRRR
jgi:hypothetical protein